MNNLKIDMNICRRCRYHSIEHGNTGNYNICGIRLRDIDDSGKYGAGIIENGSWVQEQCVMRLECVVMQNYGFNIYENGL